MWGKNGVPCTLGPLGEARLPEVWIVHTPMEPLDRRWAVRRRRTPAPGVAKERSGVPSELPESGSDSQAPQTPLSTEEVPCRFWGPWAARRPRTSGFQSWTFQVPLDVSEEARNRVGMAGGLWPRGLRGKGQGERAPAGYCRDESLWLGLQRLGLAEAVAIVQGVLLVGG